MNLQSNCTLDTATEHRSVKPSYALLEAADSAGGKAGLVGYLASQARENPVAFLGLLGKLVPSQIAAEVTQSVATVTADIMALEEWAKQWAERKAH